MDGDLAGCTDNAGCGWTFDPLKRRVVSKLNHPPADWILVYILAIGSGVRFQVPAQQSALFAIPTVDLYSDLDQASAVASLIDQTLLKPEASKDAILGLCSGARSRGFATVCVNPYWVEVARRELDGSAVKVCTVIGFPLGANETATKVCEAERALSQGAGELDMVLNIGALRGNDSDSVLREISQLVQARPYWRCTT